MKIITPIICVLLLAGCADNFSLGKRPDRIDGAGTDSGTRPAARPVLAPKPSKSARTAEQFDTTTSEQRAQAASLGGEGRRLGTTIASLGDVSEPGFWLKTPLVSKQQEGSLTYPVNGKSVQVTLFPIEGPDTAGSRVSLAAMRLLEAPLSGLPELVVYAR